MSESLNIARYLPEIASRQPETLAVAFPVSWDGARHGYQRWDYRTLEAESNRIARGLQSIGITRAMRTVLMVRPSLEFFALTFAMFKIGAVPVLIDPGLGLGNLKQCLAEAEPEAFIGIPKAHVARLLFGWGKATLKILVTVGGPKYWGGVSLADVKSADGAPVLEFAGEKDTAAILFTSGSTGVPKGAVYTHGNFDTQVRILKRIYNIEPGEIDLPTFPLFALFAPALGMSSVIPDMDFTRPAEVDAAKIASAAKEFQITQMFGSPALINRVGRYLEKNKIRLEGLKRVVSAGAPVAAKVLERMSAHIPDGAEIHTPYGATEGLPVATIGSKEILSATRFETAKGAGVCVGRPVRETEVKIITITDRAIPVWSEDLKVRRGRIGEIAVKGPVVTSGYYGRDDANRLSKIRCEDGSFYHRMGDVGYLDENGRIWFCGRKAHRVSTPEHIFYSVPCEAVFNEHPDVFRTALVGVESERLMRPVLCVELEKDRQDVSRDKVKAELLGLGRAHDHTRPIDTFLFHPGFPVDIRHNAKIFREKLAVWAWEELR